MKKFLIQKKLIIKLIINNFKNEWHHRNLIDKKQIDIGFLTRVIPYFKSSLFCPSKSSSGSFQNLTKFEVL